MDRVAALARRRKSLPFLASARIGASSTLDPVVTRKGEGRRHAPPIPSSKERALGGWPHYPREARQRSALLTRGGPRRGGGSPRSTASARPAGCAARAF